MRVAATATAAIAALVAALAPTTPAAADDRETVMIRTEDISTIEVVRERPLSSEEVKDGVRTIFARRMPFDPIPRFHDELCVEVAGLGEQLGAEVAGRIRANAAAAGLEVDAPGCKANALVMVVDRPERLVERLREEHPQLFSVAAVRQIEQQLGGKRPAIVWSLGGLRNSRGAPLNGSSALPGGTVVTANAGVAWPQTDAYSPSRIRNPFSRSKELSVVVFDVRQLADVHLVQLADYATVQLLATPRADGALTADEVPTILSLFALGPRKAPPELTALDRAYLKGLYAMDPNDWSSRLGGFALAAYEAEQADDGS
jgi:hypothetical protein